MTQGPAFVSISVMLKEKLSALPVKPGVYIFKDRTDTVIYVGKAKNLRNRIKTYFQRPDALDMRKASMVKLIADFSFIITENELEALILEANLIKQYKPKFNIILRDDKNYPYLKLTTGEKWPRLEVVRKIVKGRDIYFGPYVPSQSMWEAVNFIRKNFPIRTCKHSLDKPMRPCIQHQMGRCVAPCADIINRDEYMKIVEAVRLFLSGKRRELLKDLEEKMARLSGRLDFEAAARIRDRIKNLSHVWEAQRVISPRLGDIDVIGFCADSTDAAINVFFIRSGILIGKRDFYLKGAGASLSSETLHGFIEMFYLKEIIPPDEIIAGCRPEDMKNLEAWLTDRKGRKVEIKIPRKAKRFELLAMADENASQLLNNRKGKGTDEVLQVIKERLTLPFVPASIGAFDVSTTSGGESVGAFIYWAEGGFIKDMYRNLKIKNVTGVDDYSMMREVIARTLKNLGDKAPDLIIVDGGKGHLETAKEVIGKYVSSSSKLQPMLVAIAKDPDRAFLVPGEVVALADGSASSLLLRKIRDEVHRFAISYHKKLRHKNSMESPLEKVHGIGKKRRLELLRHFGSLEAIRSATIDDITSLKGFNRHIAKTLLNALR